MQLKLRTTPTHPHSLGVTVDAEATVWLPRMYNTTSAEVFLPHLFHWMERQGVVREQGEGPTQNDQRTGWSAERAIGSDGREAVRSTGFK